METVSKPNVAILGWRREDGKLTNDHGERKVKGWYCWVCPTDDNAMPVDEWLQDWFKEHMTGRYDCDHRFNGGTPMHTVYIRSKKDAMFFALTFLNV